MYNFMIKYEKFSQISQNICFLELSEEFCKDSKYEFKSAMVNELMISIRAIEGRRL